MLISELKAKVEHLTINVRQSGELQVENMHLNEVRNPNSRNNETSYFKSMVSCLEVEPKNIFSKNHSLYIALCIFKSMVAIVSMVSAMW